MPLSWRTLDHHWNTNRFVAWSLPSLAALTVVHGFVKPQSPGVSIGLLGLAAGIVSLRPKMHPAEKLSWVPVLIFLAILEVKAIGTSDEQNRSARQAEADRFDQIAKNISTSVSLSKTQYGSTLNHVDNVLRQTQHVAEQATRNLDATTGGDTYAYFFLLSEKRGALSVQGTNSMRSVVVNVIDVYRAELFREALAREKVIDTEEMLTRFDTLVKRVQLGDLPPQTIKDFDVEPPLVHNNQVRYTVTIYALNGTLDENYIRQKVGNEWLEAIRVVHFNGMRKGQKVFEQVDPRFPRNSAGDIDWIPKDLKGLTLRPGP